MPCALAPASAPPLRSYLTAASDLCVQDSLWSSDEQEAIRQGNEHRLHYLEPMDIDDSSQNQAEGDPPSESKDRTFGPSEAPAELLTIPALQSRISLMLAAAGGGPVASGLEAIVPRAGISHELIPDVIAAVEKAFAEHGEKALRANCGGKLAKDESYGFLLADLVLGAIIPRDKAIALGEKMRKENKKIKTKRDGFRDGRSRALAKLPEGERAEAGADWDARRDAYLAGICEAELPIPELASAVAGVREQVKQEVKQEEVKREPAPTAPAALPSAATTSLTDLRNAAEAAWALHERLGTEEDALLEKVKRFSQARERRGTPKPPPRARGSSSIHADGLSTDGATTLIEAAGARWAAYETDIQEYRRKGAQLSDMLIKLELLSRDREAACQAWEAAEALYEQRKETLEAKLKAVELQMMMAEMVLQRDRDLTRTKLLADAEKVWGPGHASRPPLAVHNLCGPLPPAPPPVKDPTGSWVGSRLPPSPPTLELEF